MEELSMEEGEVTNRSRTIAPENSNHVLARVAVFMGILIQIIVEVLGYVRGVMRTIVQDYLKDVIETAGQRFSEYWPDDDSDEDSIEIGDSFKEERDICKRIFFSPLTRKSIFILSCIAVALDPLFFYIPIIDEKDKCLGIDKNLRTAALIFRALPDATFALRTIISGYTIYSDETDDSLGILTRTYMCSIIGFVGILIAVSLMLPIPQLAIVVFYFKPGGSGHLGQRVTVSVFLIIYYLARVFLICISSTNNMFHAGKWVRATLNLFFYILASHVLGGFWYFFSIQREISCWYKYCENTKACGTTYYCSGSSSRNATFINELCPTNPPNATALNFGIFFDAIESGITRSKHFTTRFLYCLWWGVRNLSNFGTNLQTSSYEWENCFAVVISIIGMLLFLYLLGNLQIYLQHAAIKLVDADTKAEELRPKIDGKKNEIRTWMETNNVQLDFVDIRRSELVKHIDDEVDVKFIFSVMADYSKTIIQRRICLEKLKSVNKLKDMNYYKLFRICKYLKPKIFQENTQIFEAGRPLHSMIYIVSGYVRVYPTEAPSQIEILEKGIFVGEQLLDWATKTKTFDDQPKSKITVRCPTKVEAFVLSVGDLKTWFFESILPKNAADGTKWRREKQNAILSWMKSNGISDDMAKDIMHGYSQNKLEDAEVDVNYIFFVLEEYGRSIMQRHFCMKTLKKVKELQHMNDRALGTICDYLKPKVFEENEMVVEAGQPLNAMLYIIAGSMQADLPITDAGEAGSMQADLPITDAGEAAPSNSFDTLKKGMVVGEQLLYWAMKTKAFDDQPASFKTIRCTTKVEAFALTVDDLKTLSLSGDIFPMKFKVRLLKIAVEPKIHEKLEVIFLWMAINGVSDDVALDIMRGISQHKLEENIDAEVDVNYMFFVLDEYGKSIMRHHFCKETLKKANKLQNMSDYALKTICKYLKPKMVEEEDIVVEEGQPLNSMLIIISGSLQAYQLPTRDAGEAAPSKSFETLEKGMFVGEQLLYWAMKTKTFDDQPISFKTVRCSKKVEAFALTVDDLKTLVHSRHIFQLKSKVGKLKIAGDPKIDDKLEVVFFWMSINGISDDLVLDIMRGISEHKLEESKDAEADVNYIFSVLDEYGRSIIRHHFCTETLKKVKELQNMNDQALGTICDYLKPKMFEENAQVVEAGQPLNMMLIIISGSMQAYLPIRDAGDARPSTSFETLEKGMCVGEQLLDWAAKTKTFYDQPVSFKTIRCTEKVEAFALTVNDLKTLVLSGDIFPMESKGEV